MRYIISKPVERGNQWFYVHDTEDPKTINQTVGSVAAWVPNAEQKANTLLDEFNKG